MAKDNESGIVNILLLAGAGIAAYWYITNYGPSGAVSAGGVSWWNTWFGATAPVLNPGTQPVTTQPVTTTTPPPTPAPPPVTTPVFQVPAGFSVVGDINNAVKGTVLINGQPVTLDVILGNVGNSSGVVWNTAGQDVTGSLPSGVLAPLITAFQSAASVMAQQGMNGIVPAFQARYNPSLAGAAGIPSMSFGKGFGSGFSNRRKSTPPMGKPN